MVIKLSKLTYIFVPHFHPFDHLKVVIVKQDQSFHNDFLYKFHFLHPMTLAYDPHNQLKYCLYFLYFYFEIVMKKSYEISVKHFL